MFVPSNSLFIKGPETALVDRVTGQPPFTATTTNAIPPVTQSFRLLEAGAGYRLLADGTSKRLLE